MEWLYTVCRNAAIDARRKDRRMSTLTDETEAATAGRERAPDSPAETLDSAHRILSLMPN